MKRTRCLALAAWTVFVLVQAPLAATAQEAKESPLETITRLKREAAQLRMELQHAKMSAAKAKTTQAEAVQQMKEAAVGQAMLQKQIAELNAAVKAATTQNERLQALLKANADGASDVELKNALSQLVEALKTTTRLKARNDALIDQNKTQKAESARLAELFTKTRRDLAIANAALSDARQELAIEKGKRIAPANTTTSSKPVEPKVTTVVTPKVKPKVEAQINTTVRAVRGELASIGVGSADGVTAGMKLVISRGDDYVATLVISQVEKGQAAGELVNIKTKPRSGDRVGNMP